MLTRNFHQAVSLSCQDSDFWEMGQVISPRTSTDFHEFWCPLANTLPNTLVKPKPSRGLLMQRG